MRVIMRNHWAPQRVLLLEQSLGGPAEPCWHLHRVSRGNTPKQAPQCFVSCTPQEFLTFPSWSAGFETQTFFRVLQSFFISKIWKPHLIQISACLTHQDLLQQKALFTDRYLHLAFSYFSLGQIQDANNDIPQNIYWHWSPTSLQIGTGCPKCPCLFLQADTWSGHSASLKMLLSICVVPTNVGWIHHTTWAGDT